MIHEAGGKEGGRETALPVLNQGGGAGGGGVGKKTRDIGVRGGKTRDNLIQLETRPGRRVPRWPLESSVQGLVVALLLGWGAQGRAQSLSGSPHPPGAAPEGNKSLWGG